MTTQAAPLSGDVQTPAGAQNAGSAEHMIPKSRFDEVNNRLKDYEVRLKAAEDANRAAEEARLKEQNNYKELHQKSQEEVARLKPKAELVDSYEATLQGLLTAQIASIPEDKRVLVPEALTTQQKLDWIAKNRAVLMNPAAPDLGAGRRGGSNPPAPTDLGLTEEELAIAKRFGMTPEEYAKNK